MDQRINLRAGSLPPLPTGILATAAVGSATAHAVAAAAGPVGMMAWWMGAMGISCLACAVPLVRGRFCARNVANAGEVGTARNDTRRAAGHLVAMTAVMILIHLVLLVAPGSRAHHGGAGPVSPSSHDATMLALIAVELLCLIGASAALRLARRSPHRRRAPAA